MVEYSGSGKTVLYMHDDMTAPQSCLKVRAAVLRLALSMMPTGTATCPLGGPKRFSRRERTFLAAAKHT